jgi:hypothetical protein
MDLNFLYFVISISELLTFALASIVLYGSEEYSSPPYQDSTV